MAKSRIPTLVPNYTNSFDSTGARCYGSRKEGYSGSIAWDVDLHGSLLPCPFCGGTVEDGVVEIVNTHTPCYWVRCDCGAEFTGESGIADDCKYWKSLKLWRSSHDQAMAATIKGWNTRAGLSKKEGQGS